MTSLKIEVMIASRIAMAARSAFRVLNARNSRNSRLLRPVWQFCYNPQFLGRAVEARSLFVPLRLIVSLKNEVTLA